MPTHGKSFSDALGKNMGLKIWIAAFALASPISSVHAQSDLPPAPDYYLDATIAMSLAEQYADNCPQVVVNHTAIGYIYQGVLSQLDADGFPTASPASNMQLPPQEETDAPILAMLERNNAATDPTASFCAEALVEIDAKSQIGGMIEKVSP